MIIINSGAYISSELRAEFGLLPPCLLPLANKKLIEYQIEELRRKIYYEKIYVTLPATYRLTNNDKKIFDKLDVNLVFTDDNFSLSESILYVLNIYNDDTPIRILHGDTYIKNIPLDTDVIHIGYSLNDYIWKVENKNKRSVWTGYFSFSSCRHLVSFLALSKGDFKKAISEYIKLKSIKYSNDGEWYDLGHLNTYFSSRKKITTERIFNHINIKNNILTKSGAPLHKINAESLWFEKIPKNLKQYIPQLISPYNKNNKSYSLEYLPLSPLNELYIHGANPVFFWEKVFFNIRCFLNDMLLYSDKKKSIEDPKKLYINKTIKRLHLFCKDNEISFNNEFIINGIKTDSLKKICHYCFKRTKELKIINSIVHGDLCFSNILLDLRQDTIKVIDPRGLTGSNIISIYGDQKYELAKLTHSVIGLYDFIISGFYSFSMNNKYNYELFFHLDKRIIKIQKLFFKYNFLKGITVRDVIPLTILLFLSMLPLHYDNKERQFVLFANALRLYSQFKIDNKE